MLVLWSVAIALVIGYYCSATVASALQPLADWQKHSGYCAAALNRMIFCGLLPGLFQLTVAELRPRRRVLTILAQSCWLALFGVFVDAFYRLLDIVVGAGDDPVRILVKTGLNQFVWTVILVAPANAVFYFWVARDFSFGRVRTEWPKDFVRNMLFPNLVSNWIVWIPVNLAVFALPQPLQVQVSGLVGAFWTLLCLQIGNRT